MVMASPGGLSSNIGRDLGTQGILSVENRLHANEIKILAKQIDNSIPGVSRRKIEASALAFIRVIQSANES